MFKQHFFQKLSSLCLPYAALLIRFRIPFLGSALCCSIAPKYSASSALGTMVSSLNLISFVVPTHICWQFPWINLSPKKFETSSIGRSMCLRYLHIIRYHMNTTVLGMKILFLLTFFVLSLALSSFVVAKCGSAAHCRCMTTMNRCGDNGQPCLIPVFSSCA